MINKGDIADLLISTALEMSIGSPALAVYQQGVVEPPNDVKKYIVIEYVPNESANLFVGNDAPSWHQGFLQATVVWPVGSGTVVIHDHAGLIIEAWRKGTILQGTGFKLKVHRQPSERGPIKDGKSLRMPVIIPYQVIAR